MNGQSKLWTGVKGPGKLKGAGAWGRLEKISLKR